MYDNIMYINFVTFLGLHMCDVCVEKGMYMYYASLKKLMHIDIILLCPLNLTMIIIIPPSPHPTPPSQLRVIKTAVILSRLIITAVSLLLP